MTAVTIPEGMPQYGDVPRFDVERVRADFPILSREVYGEKLAYLDSAIVVLAGSNVAGGACEVNGEVRLRGSGDSRKVRAYSSLPVVTHRVSGVVIQTCKPFFTIPEPN